MAVDNIKQDLIRLLIISVFLVAAFISLKIVDSHTSRIDQVGRTLWERVVDEKSGR